MLKSHYDNKFVEELNKKLEEKSKVVLRKNSKNHPRNNPNSLYNVLYGKP